MSKVTIFQESCKGVEDCGICLFVCPKELFQAGAKMNAAGYIPPEMKDEKECTGCQNCMIYCPDFAVVADKPARNNSQDSEARDEQ